MGALQLCALNNTKASSREKNQMEIVDGKIRMKIKVIDARRLK